MKKRWILLGISVLLLVAFFIWANNYYRAMEQVRSALVSSEQVQVTRGSVLEFIPAKGSTRTGFIFYPGGKVEPTAYAPLVRAIAEQGYPAYIVSMPLKLAVLNYQAANKVIEKNPEVDRWVIAGHSLGGAMAAHYLYKNPEKIAGLVLLAAYPPSQDDLSSLDISVLSIYGSKDGLAVPEKVVAAQESLPADTQWLEIQGGNHAQFGWYGPQSGDQPADLKREEQQQIVINAIGQFMNKIK